LLSKIDERLPTATITRVDAMRVALPLKKPMLMAGVRIDIAENMLVRIEASDGTVGWGEATCAPTMTGDLPESLISAVTYLSPFIVGKETRTHAVIMRNCLAAMHGNGGAKSAIDMALLDLVGRQLGVATVDLLGGAVRQSVQPMWLLGNSSVEKDIEEAKAREREGFAFFKLKVGVKRPDEEIDAINLLRSELGGGTILCADGNAGLSLANAVRFARMAGDLDLLYLEQPLKAEDLKGMATLAALGTIPICADEGIAGAPDVLAHERVNAMSGINLKLMKVGGPRSAIRVAAVCEAFGLAMTIAGKIAESSISASNTLAVACAAHNVEWGLNLTHIYLADDLVKTPLQTLNGAFGLQSGGGNGLSVDEAKVERYRVP